MGAEAAWDLSVGASAAGVAPARQSRVGSNATAAGGGAGDVVVCIIDSGGGLGWLWRMLLARHAACGNV